MRDDDAGNRVLVIEDEPGMRSFLRDVLAGQGLAVDEAADGDTGLALARQNAPALVMTDLRMPGLSGLPLVRALRGLPDPPEVVVLTAYGSVSTAVEAMKAGALDFLEKPVSGPDQVRLIAHRALERRGLAAENERLRRETRPPSVTPILADEKMRLLMDRLRRVAETDTTVLILGESGVGKEVVARVLHWMRFGDRGPFVAINCAAVPETLLESELFGHEKGAFTGAAERKLGLFEVASPGSLFLDEIAEMPPGLQAKLLRVLETREFSRLGSTRTQQTRARIIAATNQDLAKAVAAGRFRQDLYYRLEVFPVVVPPLRERPADVRALARAFLQAQRRKLGRPSLEFGPGFEDALAAYDWPGNVRELRNAIERACILADGDTVEVSDLGLPIRAGVCADMNGTGEGLLAALEREAILRELRENNGNRKATARRLGISLRTLQYRLKEFGLV